MNDINEEFLLERYKYVLSQKQILNQATMKIATVYQTGLGLIISGQFAVVASAQLSDLKILYSWSASLALLAMLFVLTSFSVSMLISGMLSWIEYRNEENCINLKVNPSAYDPVSISNVYRWYELYILIAVLLIFVIFSLVEIFVIIPHLLIKQ